MRTEPQKILESMQGNRRIDYLLSNKKKICRQLSRNHNSLYSMQIIRSFMYKISQYIKDFLFFNQTKQYGEYFSQMHPYLYILKKNKLYLRDLMQRNEEDIIKLNHLKLHNPNLLITNYLNDKIGFFNQCPNCQKDFHYQSILNFSSDHQIFPIEKFNFKQKGHEQNLAKYICSGLNAGSALIAIGVTEQNRIKGIQVEKAHIYQLESTVQKIRRHLVFPEPQKDQIINVQFVRLKDSISNILQSEDIVHKKQSYSKQKQIGVIKIYINTRNVNKRYFIQRKNEKGGYLEYKMWKDPKSQLLQLKSYEQILLCYKRQKKGSFHDNIRCLKSQKSQYELQYKNTMDQIKKTIISTSQFGRQPVKKHQHEYMVVYNPESSKINEFISELEKLGQPFEYYQIYQRLIKNTNRNVYYLSHHKRYSQIQAIAQKVDSKKKHLVLLKLKPHLTLLRQQYFLEAYQILQPRYHQCFGRDLQIRVKHIYSKKSVQTQYYFCFRQKQTIFAFICLQMANIRTNFVSDNKLQGTVLINQL